MIGLSDNLVACAAGCQRAAQMPPSQGARRRGHAFVAAERRMSGRRPRSRHARRLRRPRRPGRGDRSGGGRRRRSCRRPAVRRGPAREKEPRADMLRLPKILASARRLLIRRCCLRGKSRPAPDAAKPRPGTAFRHRADCSILDAARLPRRRCGRIFKALCGKGFYQRRPSWAAARPSPGATGTPRQRPYRRPVRVRRIRMRNHHRRRRFIEIFRYESAVPVTSE